MFCFPLIYYATQKRRSIKAKESSCGCFDIESKCVGYAKQCNVYMYEYYLYHQRTDTVWPSHIRLRNRPVHEYDRGSLDRVECRQSHSA